MMRRADWTSLDAAGRKAALARPPRRSGGDIPQAVARILDDVEREGFDAVRRWARTIDGVEPFRLDLTPRLVDKARADIAREDIAAIECAVDHVRRFHAATRPADIRIEMSAGLVCEKIWRPLDVVGLYVPGGGAPLVSSLIMLAEPARTAGVRKIIAATPPRAGSVAPAMIVAGALCGLDALWAMGGAQAIAAMAFGAGLPPARKICGPGNAFVAEAKRQVAARGLAAIDLPAGPSELLVIADASADMALVAADLLSQAEHDADAQTLAVVFSPDDADRLAKEVDRQLGGLPRADIARVALENGFVFLADRLEDAVEIANGYAPEHLSLHVAAPEILAARIQNAGAIFVGAASAEVFGDYLAGPSHVLPTDGAARSHGGVTVESFMKPVSVQTLSRGAASALAASAARLARLEGLEAHARAAEMRR
jgi:histidinol dehydrogenase